jgi:cytochrome o ubiquinol oxidase subunit 1
MIGMSAMIFGAAIIWHLWWLALIMLIVVLVLLVKRTLDDDTEYTLSVTEILRHEKEATV